MFYLASSTIGARDRIVGSFTADAGLTAYIRGCAGSCVWRVIDRECVNFTLQYDASTPRPYYYELDIIEL